MASIKLNNISKEKNKSTIVNDFTYTDITLDLQYDISNNANLVDQQQLNRDLRVSPDEFAIRNSLINLFNTRRGQRILLPRYGVDLDGWLFEAVSKTTGEVLGDLLLDAIETWEPRVTVKKVKVIAEAEKNQYSIIISIGIPSLKYKTTTIFGTLTNEGFRETNNSEFI